MLLEKGGEHRTGSSPPYRGLLFYRLLQQAVELDPMPYRRLVEGKSADPNP